MNAPLRFAHRNIVFGDAARDTWAVYRLEMESYEGLTAEQKIDLLATVAGFAFGLAADFQLLRVSRTWSVDDYVARARAGVDRRFGDEHRFLGYLETHRRELLGRTVVRPELYLSVRLAPPLADPLDQVLTAAGRAASDPRGVLKRLRALLRRQDARALSERRLLELAGSEERTFARIGDFFEAERATALDLQWLCRRAFTRGLGEPAIDVHWRPQALAVLDGEAVAYRPLEADVLRLFDSPLYREDRGLRVESERGTSYQALCALGALPESATFPGEAAELLFAPLEAVGFPVDACFSAQYIPNDRATALVRRKVVDADNIWSEETHGEHGPTGDSARRPHAARALEDYLTGEGRPPLLLATTTLAIGADSPEERERRFERLQTEYGTVTLHRPLGEQLNLFCQHFPGQATKVGDYADYLLLEQLGAMMPIATHAAGSDRGTYLGHTLTGSRQPVLFDLREASRTSRPPAILLCGTLGSGKTQTLQRLEYEDFLQGGRVVDIDPKGDHRIEDLPGVRDELERIELRGDEQNRGRLDPLRIAPPGTEEDFTTSFLIDVLPHPVPPTWRTEIRRAVKQVVVAAAAGEPANCVRVVKTLLAGDETAQEVGRALEVYADSGLAQLGFADDDTGVDAAGHKRFISLRIRNLARPAPGTPKEDLSEEERIGRAVLRLVAAYAMHLMGTDRSVHKTLGFEEAFFLLEDAAGRRLLDNLCRWGRSENATVVLVAHFIRDAEELDNLIGYRLMFGMESDAEARAALALLRLDADDQRLRRRLLSYRKGRCMMRDLHGRVSALQVYMPDELLSVLDTTPAEREPAPAAAVEEDLDEVAV
jgi:hypothetical protein